MKLEKLTIELLIKLKDQGYNIITYNIRVSEHTVIWFPKTVLNIQEYLLGLSNLGKIVYEDPNILVIDYAIDNLCDNELIGDVLVPEYSKLNC